MSAFLERLKAASLKNRSLLCVGLDPDPALMPVPDVLEFNRAIIDATADLVCAYKPNLPFYESLGLEGLRALEKTVAWAREQAPGVIVLGDGKRGDIGSTNTHYARALFQVWGFDAATVNCYAGGEALEPFFQYRDRGVFVWCRSSNPGAREFQDLRLWGEGQAIPLYQWVARRTQEWNVHGNAGLVVGATYPEELQAIRALCPDMPLLIPGIGSQGGDLQKAVRYGTGDKGASVIISASRSITYASRDRSGFARAARKAAQNLRDTINRILEEEGKGW